MFATIELQKQAAADRYHHQLHPKPWAKSPEEAALAVACSGALDPNWGRFWGEFFPSRGLWSMSGWCRGYWSSQGRVEKGRNWERYTRKNVLFLRGGESTTFPRLPPKAPIRTTRPATSGRVNINRHPALRRMPRAHIN